MDVGVERAFRVTVGVTYVVARNLPFAANNTYSAHCITHLLGAVFGRNFYLLKDFTTILGRKQSKSPVFSYFLRYFVNFR